MRSKPCSPTQGFLFKLILFYLITCIGIDLFPNDLSSDAPFPFKKTEKTDLGFGPLWDELSNQGVAVSFVDDGKIEIGFSIFLKGEKFLNEISNLSNIQTLRLTGGNGVVLRNGTAQIINKFNSLENLKLCSFNEIGPGFFSTILKGSNLKVLELRETEISQDNLSELISANTIKKYVFRSIKNLDLGKIEVLLERNFLDSLVILDAPVGCEVFNLFLNQRTRFPPYFEISFSSGNTVFHLSRNDLEVESSK